MGKSVPSKKSFKSTVYSHIQNVDSHIDNVKNSLERLVFSSEKEIERALFKKRIKVVVSLTLVLMVIGTYFSPKGKAEVATFYPSSCLGGWNNPHNAEGRPETLDAAPQFSLTNSASLAKDVLADLYCGGFKGDVPTETVPTKIMLTIAWKGLTDAEVQPIVGSSFASSSLQILDATSSEGFTLDTSSTTATTTPQVESTDTPATSPSVDSSVTPASDTPAIPADTSKATDTTSSSASGGDTSTSQVQTPTPTPTPSQAPTPDSTPAPVAPPTPTDTSAPQSWLYKVGSMLFSMIVDTVYALDDTMIASSTDGEASSSVLVTSTTTDSSHVAAGPVASTSGEVLGTSTDDVISLASTTLPSVASASTSEASSVSQSSQNPMFEVLYTLDGENWMSLGKVSAEDMSYNKFEIPVTSSSTWDDISNIQIKIKSLVTPDAKPTVLVDGMALDVEYEKSASDQSEANPIADPKRYDMKITSIQGNVAAEVVDDPSQGMTLNVTSSSSASLVVYRDISGDVIFSSGIGSDILPINSYTFDPGTFTVIVTTRGNGCLGLTSKACEEDTNTIGSIHFTITPTTGTPIQYVHTE